MYNQQAPFFTQLSILTKRLLLRVIRRPLSELPNLFISAFFLFIYDGALGRVFGSSAVGTSLDFAQGNFVNFILPVSIISASLSGSASGFYIIEDIESGVFKRYQGMPISKWAIILAPMCIGAIRVLVQASLILLIGSFIGADPATGFSGYVAVLGFGFLWGLGFAGYSVAASVKSGSSQGAQAASFFFFPALFLAPTFVPREALKGWLSTAAAFNPTTYVIEAIRGILIEGWVMDVILPGLVVGGIFALITLAYAVTSAKKVYEKG
jgi:ABC-2 type transport system permease protein|tara:strand:+ start:703 stop:1503 length:801 start_codon:yes stop_codon:yes gene_type:complete